MGCSRLTSSPSTITASMRNNAGTEVTALRLGFTTARPWFVENHTFPEESLATERKRLTPSVPAHPSSRAYTRKSELSSVDLSVKLLRFARSTRVLVATHSHPFRSS